MSSYIAPLTAGLVFILGYWLYGWRGLVLAATILVFWLLMQFHRALKVMRRASGRPVGLVPSAVMLQSKLQLGLNLQEVITLAGSLGQKVEGEADDWRWHDNAGHEVVVCLRRGRVVRWYFARGDDAQDPPAPDAPALPGASAGASAGASPGSSTGASPGAPATLAAEAQADPGPPVPPPEDLLYRPDDRHDAPPPPAPAAVPVAPPAGPRN